MSTRLVFLDANLGHRALRFGWRTPLVLAATACIVFAAPAARAEEARPKLGPDAVSIQQSHAYIRNHDAPDYWALSPYYAPQPTPSACSLAAITMLVNALRGMPPNAADRLVTPSALLAAVGSREWAEKSADGGAGVSWDEFERYLRLSLQAFSLDTDLEIMRPRDVSAASLEQLRKLLADNEENDRDIVLIYYDQGVLTGDWDGPHVSPVAAYDADHQQVLIMDVDRRWYLPYWSSDERLLEAMVRPAPPERGVLAGETGGLIRVRLKTPLAH